MTTRVLVLATEWLPAKGGVSTFNLDLELCCALHRSGYEVHCVVPRAIEADTRDASSKGVQLHSAAEHGVADGAPFELQVSFDVVVGHDRWTGPQAARWRERYPSMRLALLLHVHPEQIDGLKSEASIAARAGRTRNNTRRIGNADAAFGVGEQLTRWWQTNAPQHQVNSFVPGLPTTLPSVLRCEPPQSRVLLLGRGEDAQLKGIPLAARAMRRVVDAQFSRAPQRQDSCRLC